MFGKIILSLLIIVALTLIVSAYYIYIKRYKIIGKLTGATIVGVICGVIFNYLLKGISNFFTTKLDINILAIFIGIVISIEILHKVTPE